MTPTCDKTLAVIAMIEGEVSAANTRELEAHAAECPHCRAAIEEVQTLSATLSRAAAAPVDAEVWSNLEPRLQPSRPAAALLALAGAGLMGWRAFEMAAGVSLEVWTTLAPLALAIALFAGLRVNPFRVEPRLI
jgi:anti-sigma factor RsiW